MLNRPNRFYKGVIKHLLQFESEVLYLHLDLDGIPSIGMGFRLPNKERFCKLPLIDRRSKQTATLQQKLDEYHTISQQPQGHKASWYAQHTKLTLAPKISKALLTRRLKHFERVLSTLLTKQSVTGIPYKALPTPAKTALLEMAYNIGCDALQANFSELLTAIVQQDWQAAATACRRHGISPSRNEATQALFLQCGNYPRVKLSWFELVTRRLKRLLTI
ncbi:MULTISPECIES: glycoside hydrolase family protein [unclassified Pseudoalteromonas]|uniref:glycoside hydrolase family protein n=1 Tax=unclassified Pseudoalteromonas TaxID=194690 RepID=UPI0030149F7B